MTSNDHLSPSPLRRSIRLLVSVTGALVATLASAPAPAQQPTTQDCPGAIPVCQPIFTQPNGPPNGQGNILNELSPQSCLATGEVNDVWYVFTVQTGGNLSFVINPNDPQNDYDWAVYDLTTANCANIATNPALEVSCNYAGAPGPTGPTGAAGPAFNPPIAVQPGETYVVNVSNFSTNAVGYTLDFSGSTATIFDTALPTMATVSPPSCNGGTIDVTFSELIQCSSVQNGDFQVIGPGVRHAVTGFVGAGCGTQSNSFQLTTDPPLSESGSYSLCLVGSAGSVADLCGNLATPHCVPFTFIASREVSISASSESICRGESVTLSAADPGDDLVWTPGGQTGATITVAPIQTTTYTAQSRDAAGCPSSAAVTIEVSDLTVDLGEDVISCEGDQTWDLSTTVTGGASGTNPVQYQWSHGAAGPTTSVPAFVSSSYGVTVTDAKGCSATDEIQVLLGDRDCLFSAEYDNTDQLPPFTQRQDSITAAVQGPVTVKGTDVVAFQAGREIHLLPGFVVERGGRFKAEIDDCRNCTRPQVAIAVDREGHCTSRLTANVSGGSPAYSFSWSSGLGTSSSVTVPHEHTASYGVTVTDAAGLTNSADVEIEAAGFWGRFPSNAKTSSLTWTNGLDRGRPSGDQRGRLSIYHLDPPNIDNIFLVNPAYNAYRFQLQVFDRFGSLIYVQDEESFSGFHNGSIHWEGHTNIPFGGPGFSKLVYDGPILANRPTKVPAGVYNWKLILWNCSREAFPIVAVPQAVTVVG